MERAPRTFSFRALVIGIAAMVLMGMWIHYHEVLAPQPNILAENSPPASAVGVFLGVLLVGALVAKFRTTLRLAAGELLVVYSMLVISAPLMSQGMWHRFLGLIIAIPENQENMPLVDSFSDKLWPHGEQLIPNRRFGEEKGDGSLFCEAPGRPFREKTPVPFFSADPAGRVEKVSVPESPVGRTTGARLAARSTGSGQAGREGEETTLRIRVPRRRDGREMLVPGERYYATALFKLSGFQSRSALTMELVTD